ncbi:MAG: DNA alkylation repair protein [Candidatus Bathyarchaeota archaeon]|nr:DNA alkylation repair protein [Candidatus Bathyarchaeota archaeon]
MVKLKPSITEVVDAIHHDLLTVCTEKMREAQSRYFKEQVTFLGCSLPQCNRISNAWSKKLKMDGWVYDDILLIAEALMKAGTFEEGVVGLNLVSHYKKYFRESDFNVFERWLRDYVSNWAHTDSIAPHVIGELLEKYPGLTESIFKWTKSDNRWMRRASAVTYVLHARHGKFHEAIFRTADALLGDEDNMVRKGLGWMLKCASQADEPAVVSYLMKNRERTTRLVLRYATEKVSPKNRELVLAHS